jgi:hypothetical protein
MIAPVDNPAARPGSPERLADLLTAIVAALQNGGRLDDAVLAYIETALFPAEAEALAAFLVDETDSARDSLLDLMFYPDPAIQLALEPLLEAARCNTADERRLQAGLIEREIRAPIRMPDGRLLVRIAVPDVTKSQYLTRLNVSWQIDPEVAAAIEAGAPAAHARVCKVRLRNARLRITPGRRAFLVRFFERMAPDTDGLACLDLALALLPTAGGETDGYDMLVRQKQALFRSLQKLDRFEIRLRKSNMETLMLQGVRTPHLSREALIEQMRRIDLICYRLYAKTEVIAAPVQERPRDVVDLATPAGAVKALLR